VEIQKLVTDLNLALEDEARAAQRALNQNYRLWDGQYLGPQGDAQLYEFRCAFDLRLESELGGFLEFAGTRRRCVIVATRASSVLLEIQGETDPLIPAAILYCDAAFLIRQLQKRLEEIVEPTLFRNADLALEIVGEKKTQAEYNGIQLDPLLGDFSYNAEQRTAIAHSDGTDVTAIWAPGGTGKTVTLAGFTRVALKRNETLLVTAPSHAGVDAVATSIAQVLRDTNYLEGAVLRVGSPRNAEAAAQLGFLLPLQLIRSHQPELIHDLEWLRQSRIEICERLRDLNLSPSRRQNLQIRLRASRQRLGQLEKEFAELESELVAKAQVIVVTLQKATVSKDIFNRMFDAVVVDEASMALPAQIVFASSLARTRLVIAGDFRQLPPVSLARTNRAKKWLKRDIFEVGNIVANVDAEKHDSRLVILRQQFRMHHRIRKLVSEVFYNGMLEDGPQVSAETLPLAAQPPWPGQAVVFCDISPLQPHTYVFDPHGRGFGSHFSLTSMLVSLDIALQAVAGGSRRVAVITPYAEHSRLIRTALRDSGMEGLVNVGTAHKFQGGQWDHVICDLVDSSPLPNLGKLLAGALGTDAARCLNVQSSRARGKLIFVGDLGYLRRHAQADWAITKIFQALNENEIRLFFPASSANDIRWSYDQRVVREAIAADIRSAQSRVLINSPTTSDEPLEWIDATSMADIDERIAIRVATQPVSESRSGLLESRGAVFCEPVSGETLVVIDNSILWRGSAIRPNSRFPMFTRASLRGTSAMIAELTGMNQLLGLTSPRLEAALQLVLGQTGQLPTRSAREIRFGVRRLEI
jgi:hypothetical protein